MGTRENQDHERPVVDALRAILGTRLSTDSAQTKIKIGATLTKIDLDAAIDKDVIVEIESRTAKQIRGALFDLLVFPRPKKLLIIRPSNANAATIGQQCRDLMARRLQPGELFTVVVLGLQVNAQDDQRRIRDGLNELGVAI